MEAYLMYHYITWNISNTQGYDMPYKSPNSPSKHNNPKRLAGRGEHVRMKQLRSMIKKTSVTYPILFAKGDRMFSWQAY